MYISIFKNLVALGYLIKHLYEFYIEKLQNFTLSLIYMHNRTSCLRGSQVLLKMHEIYDETNKKNAYLKINHI